jgi:hypothetical protein
MKDFVDLLNSIDELKVEDVKEKRIELDDLQFIHPSLTLDNPLTYLVYLDKRQDLSDEDKTVIWNIAKRLHNNEDVLYQATVGEMDGQVISGEKEN